MTYRRRLTIRRPISTYGGRGTLKPGLNPESHAIIYMSNTFPRREQEETKMTKEPISIDPAQGQKLHQMSRINFEKVYTVEHNVKVMNVGNTSSNSMPKLTQYWRIYKNEGDMAQG